MAYNAQYEVKIGDKPSLAAQLTAPNGQTYTITGGAFTLYTSSGIILVGPIAITDFDAVALIQPKAYFKLDTVVYNLVPGVYSGLFQITAQWSVNSEIQILSYNVEILAVPSFENAPATYDPTTALGQVRGYAGDSNIAQAVFSDLEFTQFLAQAGGNVLLAASLSLEWAATDAAKLSIMVKIGEYQKDSTKISGELKIRAAALRKIAITPPTVGVSCRVFSPVGYSGSWDNSYTIANGITNNCNKIW